MSLSKNSQIENEYLENLKLIPAIQTLAKLDQWVLWKDGKIPVQPNGKPAKVNDSTTYSSFDEVLQGFDPAVHKGIGFVFTDSDPYCGIDLDDCYDPKTKQFTKEAQEIIQSIDSYAEISPSGKGAKIFCYGKLPGAGKKQGFLECYDRSRYFTVTGDHVDSCPDTIEERSDEVRALYKRKFPDKSAIEETTTSAESLIHRILDRKIEEGERDTTLYKACCRWRSMGLSPEEISLFAHVANKRFVPPLKDSEVNKKVKNSLKHEPNDTGIDECDDFGEIPVFDYNDFMEIDFPPREYFLEPWIQEKTTNMIYAEPGCGKTFVSLGIAFAVASGSPIYKWNAPVPRKVLYVDGEMASEDIQTRLKSFAKSIGAEPKRGYLDLIVRDHLPGFTGNFNLDLPILREEVSRLAQDTELVILDNFTSLKDTEDENDAKSWTAFGKWIRSLKHEGKSVVVVHHTNKQGDQRGHSSKIDHLDFSIRLAKISDTTHYGGYFKVKFMKMRKPLKPSDQEFAVKIHSRPNEMFDWEVPELQEELAVKLLKENRASGRKKMKQKEIAEKTGLSESKVSRLNNKHVKKFLMEDSEL